MLVVNYCAQRPFLMLYWNRFFSYSSCVLWQQLSVKNLCDVKKLTLYWRYALCSTRGFCPCLYIMYSNAYMCDELTLGRCQVPAHCSVTPHPQYAKGRKYNEKKAHGLRWGHRVRLPDRFSITEINAI